VGYTVKQGESISDVCLNSLGNISLWSQLLDENFFDSWTPTLYNGQILQIPVSTDTNVQNIADLAQYPANNFSVPDIYSQITALFNLLATAPPVNIPIGSLPTIDTNNYYIVRPTETIGDAILNGSGDISNWSSILDANQFSDWTPTLYAGQKVAIPSTANLNLNNFRALNAYPANNNSTADIYEQINAIFDLLNGNDLWILRYGYWLDSPSQWIDTDFWRDN
jgi:LysM repeat protein